MNSKGTIDIKRAVKDGAKVYFRFYRKNELWYETIFGETFSVPIADTGDAAFNAEEKALLLMRYMRKWNKKMEEQNG